MLGPAPSQSQDPDSATAGRLVDSLIFLGSRVDDDVFAGGCGLGNGVTSFHDGDNVGEVFGVKLDVEERMEPEFEVEEDAERDIVG